MTTVSDTDLDHLRTFMAGALPSYLTDLERVVNVDCGTYSKSGVDEICTLYSLTPSRGSQLRRT